MISLELINHGNQASQTIDIKSIVSKPIERLQYSQAIDDRSIAISYLDSKEVNSQDNLEINDYSWRVKRNNINFFADEKEFEVQRNNFSVNYRDLLITNVVETDINGREKPLYWKHKRKVKEASIHFIKKGEEVEVNNGYKIVDNCIYTNYENVFNNNTGSYRVYFVEGVSLEGETFNEMLSIVPAIKEASWEDVDLDTGMFEEIVYTKQILNGSYFYEITNPISRCGEKGYSNKYFVKLLEENLIKLKKPYQYSLKNPWFLEVSNGFVFDSGFRYSIPEYRNQAFEMESGLLRLRGKESFVVTSNIFALPASPVKIDPENNIHLSLIIRNENSEIIKALTTDEDKVNTKVTSSDIMYESGIRSWDNKSGLVELDVLLDSSFIVEADFFYKTNNIVLNELNVNLYSNKKLLTDSAFYYLVPNQEEKSLYYFLVDEEDRITKTSNPKFDVFYNGNFNQSNNMIGKTLKYFLENYCAGWQNNYLYMPLGKINLIENFYSDEINEIDVRQKSYLNDTQVKEFFNRQHKALQSKFGYGDKGQCIQKNNLVYVKYPLELLSKYGGDYTEGELVRLTKRKLPKDVDVVVEYDYLKSKLSFTQNANSITIAASWEGVGEYIIEKSLSEFGEKTQIFNRNSTTEETISYVDTSVTSGKTYWYWVRINTNPRSNTYGVYKS